MNHVNEKYYNQFLDANTDIGYTVPKIYDNEKHLKPIINLGYMTGETIPLAHAINQISSEVSIRFIHLLNGGTYTIKGNRIVPVEYIESTFSLQELRGVLCHGNAEGFKKYSENKWLTYKILQNAGIKTPEQILVKHYGKVNHEKIRALFGNSESGVVLKPMDGSCGKNITIFDNIQEAFRLLHECSRGEENYILQERIPSFPIEIDGQKKDWNLRVLVTFDSNNKYGGGHIVAGITGRIDDDGGPVNRSISAENISFQELSKLAGWSHKQFQDIEKQVKDMAVKSVESIVSAGCRKYGDIVGNYQNLAGIDIIINEDMTPVVIEVNDSNSGCMYELFKLEGIDSLYPIAESIIGKTWDVFDNMVRIFARNFVIKVTEKHGKRDEESKT